MDINNIVKVSITHDELTNGTNKQLNLTCAVLLVAYDATAASDTSWKTSSQLGTDYPGKTEVDKATAVFAANGGHDLVYFRVYSNSNSTIPGTATLKAALDTLDPKIICVYVIEYGFVGVSVSLSELATAVAYSDNEYKRKLIFATRTNLNVAGLDANKNLFYHYAQTNNHEGIIACAYVSKINYYVDPIRDYEYTMPASKVSLETSVPTPSVGQGQANVFVELLGRQIVSPGTLTDGTRLITAYFEVVLTQKITDTLSNVLLNKVTFSNAIYANLYNVLTTQLDMFALSGLLDTDFVNTTVKEVYRDDVRYQLLAAGEQLKDGYKVNTLPISASDRAERKYTGIYVHLAIANQIKSIQVTGLVIGGIK